MRVSTMIRISAAMAADGRLIDRITNFARQVEALGFPGMWIGELDGPRPPDFGFAPGIDRPCRGDVKGRARDQRPSRS